MHSIFRYAPVLMMPILLAVSSTEISYSGDTHTVNTNHQPVHLGNGVAGVLYRPKVRGEQNAIGVLVMHPGGDYLEFSAGPELARRGYTVLCANTSTAKSGISNDVGIEQLLSEVRLGVAFLRGLDYIGTVVLFGHSGGGAMMAAYQNVAENGAAIGQGPEKISPLSDQLGDLPPADGLMLVDSNYGLGSMVLFSLDPAVMDESTGFMRSPELDLFNTENGFTTDGARYSPEFIASFQAAIGYRMNRLIQTAQDRLQAIESGDGLFDDDEPFVIPGGLYLGSNNKLFAQDTTLLAQTRNAWPLLRPSGMETTTIHSVRPAKNPALLTGSLRNALVTTVRTFLSTYAVRVGPDFSYGADHIDGIAWRSSLTCPIGSVETVSVPLLTMGMTGNWEYLAAEMIYEHAASVDKSIAFVEGATHIFTPCTECESTPGEFGDTIKTTYDYIDQWLRSPGRFLLPH